MVAKPRWRPLRIKLEDVESKKQVLINAPKIRVDRPIAEVTAENMDIVNMVDSKAIFIVPDKTKMEREVDLQLRNSLTAKRQDFPQDKWKIRRGKIVQVKPVEETETDQE